MKAEDIIGPLLSTFTHDDGPRRKRRPA